MSGQRYESTVQGFLVSLDGEKVITTPADNPLGCVYLGVHRIDGEHHPAKVQRFEQDR